MMMRVVGRRATSRGEDEDDDAMRSIRTRRVVSRAVWIEPSGREEGAREGSTAPRWIRSARRTDISRAGRGRGDARGSARAETVGVKRGGGTPRVGGGNDTSDASMRRGERATRETSETTP